jgi:nucleoside-triphosphatase
LGNVILITGRPGIGKTTVFLGVVDSLRTFGWRIGGFVSREVRVVGSRVGFEIVDLATGTKGWLAHIGQREGPNVGKYVVNTSDLIEIGVGAIRRSLDEEMMDMIAVDEVGPMELTCPEFVQVISEAFRSVKPLLATIHHREKDRTLARLPMSARVELFDVTLKNRDSIKRAIFDAIKKLDSSPSLNHKSAGKT